MGTQTGFCKSASRPTLDLNVRKKDLSVNFASIPYVRGASDRVGRTLRKFNIRTAFKPCQTLSQIFKKPKDRPQDHQRRGIVYKVRCNDCAFTYIGESKRSWSSRGAEHNPGRACNGESKVLVLVGGVSGK